MDADVKSGKDTDYDMRYLKIYSDECNFSRLKLINVHLLKFLDLFRSLWTLLILRGLQLFTDAICHESEY